jgi:hypothetical protein
MREAREPFKRLLKRRRNEQLISAFYVSLFKTLYCARPGQPRHEKKPLNEQQQKTAKEV